MFLFKIFLFFFLFLNQFNFLNCKKDKKEKFKLLKKKVKCPINNFKELDPITLANLAVEEVFLTGSVEETIKCLEYSLKNIVNYQVPENAQKSIEDNLIAIKKILEPYHIDNKRLYHTPFDRNFKFPINSSEPLPPPVDNSILYWDNALTIEQCEDIIGLFNRSKLFQGNTLSNGKAVIDTTHKKTWEFDVSGTSPDSHDWWEVDKLAVMVTIKHLNLYQKANPIFNSLPNPLGDEGFRMKRYINDDTEHHGYHVDSGQEPLCSRPRILAILIYLNDVEVGGETVFYNQGVAIKPKCGRVVIFPTAFTHVHSGRRPVSNPKYVLADMITV